METEQAQLNRRECDAALAEVQRMEGLVSAMAESEKSVRAELAKLKVRHMEASPILDAQQSLFLWGTR
jgi:hypothetical protein